MTNPTYTPTRSFRIWTGNFSATLPSGWAYLVDEDGKTFFTDDNGNKWLVRESGGAV